MEGMVQELRAGAEVHPRALVEEGGRFRREGVRAVVLGQQAAYGQIIAENTGAAFAGPAAFVDGGDGVMAFANGGEKAEVDSSIQSGRLDVAIIMLKIRSGDTLIFCRLDSEFIILAE